MRPPVIAPLIAPLTASSLLLAILIVCTRPQPVQAQTPVAADPARLELAGALPNSTIGGSFRLSASAQVTNVRILVADLHDATGDGRVRDPLPSSSVTLLPGPQLGALAADALTQVVVQVAAPVAAGVYTGALTVRWDQPEPGQLAIPMQLTVRTKPVLALQQPSPAEVTINSVTDRVVERRLVLRETSGGAAITNLQGLPQDLLATDHRGLIPASRQQIQLPEPQLAGGGLLTATLRLDLRNSAAGAYSGQLLFTAEPDQLLAVPVTLNVRHHWYLPTLVLLLGVFLGLGLSTYQARGKVRDEYVLQLAAVREALAEDAELQSGFGPRIDPLLAEAEAAVRSTRWQDAEAKLAIANQLLTKWRGARQDWIDQLHHLRTSLVPRLKDYLGPDPAQAPWMLRKLLQKAEDTLKGAADQSTPEALRDRSFEIEGQLAAFLALQQRVEQLRTTRVDIQPDAQTAQLWQQTELDLHQRLQWLLPDEEEKRQQLESAIAAQEQTMAAYVSQNPPPQGQAALARSVAPPTSTAVLQPGVLVPEITQAGAYDPQAARERLQAYGWIIYVLGGVLLAAVGLNSLYVDNLTFGANLLTDYLALFLFGLGAQTTFASVADLLKRWGLPVTS